MDSAAYSLILYYGFHIGSEWNKLSHACDV